MKDLKNQKKGQTFRIWETGIHIPPAVLLILCPLVVHRAEVHTHLEQFPWHPDLKVSTDYFMFLRSRVLMIAAGYMALMILIGLSAKKWSLRDMITRKSGIIWGGICLFAAGTLISGLLSKYPVFVWGGMSEQYESLPVLICYLVIVIFTALTVRTGKDRSFLSACLLTGAGLQVLIGLSQLAGRDFWSSPAGKYLIGEGAGMFQNTEYIFSETAGHRVYMSFYHPNYAAVYIMLVLPFSTAALYDILRNRNGQTGKGRILKTGVYFLLNCGLLVCLWGTGSKSAGILLFFGVVFFLFKQIVACLNQKEPGKTYGRRDRVFLWALLCAVFILLLINLSRYTKTGEKVRTWLLGTKTEAPLKSISPDETGVAIVWNDRLIRLSMEQEEGKTWFAVNSQGGSPYPLDYDEDQKRFRLTEAEFSELSFDAYTDQGDCWIVMYQNDIPWYFVRKQKDPVWQYITLYRKPDHIVNAPHLPTFGYDNALSGRFYLWSRTVPLLGKYLIRGSGTDTFALAFPQNDYVARANVGLDLLMPVISRAHSLYLQMAVQSGLLPALCLLAGLISLPVMLLRKREAQDGDVSLQRKTAAAAVIIWMLMGMTNDSVVVITPLLCVLLGAAVSMV